MRKASSPLPNIYIVNLSPSRPQRPFARIPVHWGRGNNRHFRVLRDTGSEPTLIPGDPNVTVSHQSERGLWESSDQWNIISSPSHSGLGDQWVPKFILWFFPPVPECIIGIDILSGWRNPHVVLPGCGGVRDIMVGKARRKPLELPVLRKIVTQMPCSFLGDCRDPCHHQGLKGCRQSDSHHIPR